MRCCLSVLPGSKLTLELLVPLLHYEVVLREEAIGRFLLKVESAGSGRPRVGRVVCVGERLGEASLPGRPGLELAHRQQAISGDTLVSHDAEQLAGRHAGIFHEHLKIVTRGKTLTRLPRADGGNRNTQILGDVLERNSVLVPPVGEGGRKAGADVAVELRLFGHGKSLDESRAGIKAAQSLVYR
jgi:hypothetical protein